MPTAIYNLCKKQIYIYTPAIEPKQMSLGWSYMGMDINSLMHALNGNRNLGYRLAAWNCRKRLLNPDGSPSEKITEIKIYLNKHKLHMMGIIECDLHGPGSRVKRRQPLSTSDIQTKLYIAGNHILLPQSWYTHDQARILIYVQDRVNVKERKLETSPRK